MTTTVNNNQTITCCRRMFILSDFSLFDSGKNKRWKKSIEMSNGSNVSDTRQTMCCCYEQGARGKWPNQMATGESISVHGGSVGERLPAYSHLPVLASTNSPAKPAAIPLHSFLFLLSFFLFPLQKLPVGAATSFLPPFPPKGKRAFARAEDRNISGCEARRSWSYFEADT